MITRITDYEARIVRTIPEQLKYQYGGDVAPIPLPPTVLSWTTEVGEFGPINYGQGDIYMADDGSLPECNFVYFKSERIKGASSWRWLIGQYVGELIEFSTEEFPVLCSFVDYVSGHPLALFLRLEIDGVIASEDVQMSIIYPAPVVPAIAWGPFATHDPIPESSRADLEAVQFFITGVPVEATEVRLWRAWYSYAEHTLGEHTSLSPILNLHESDDFDSFYWRGDALNIYAIVTVPGSADIRLNAVVTRVPLS